MTESPPLPQPIALVVRFLALEAAGGLLLIGAAALALLVANSPLEHTYHAALEWRPGGSLMIHEWINDALMSLFFLVVGLEIKRELVVGHLSEPQNRMLPVLAAVGGMVAPALVYLAVAGGEPGLARGWAIPAATDIAFALGVLTLLGPRVPASLKLFLTTLAIVDDMGAVAIIALAYTPAIDLIALGGAAAVLVLMIALNRRKVAHLAPFLLLALLLWVAVWRSGIHPTVAGVLAAMTIPLQTHGRAGSPPLQRLERALHPWVAYAVVPLFGFANAGVSFAGFGWGTLLQPLPLAIAGGLVLGKQVGVFGAVRLGVALGLGKRPERAGWRQIYGVSLLAGIGFTMSLFIGGLAFQNAVLMDAVRLGVLGGSLLSALLGAIVLSLGSRPPEPSAT